jgi:hypothetical protein
MANASDDVVVRPPSWHYFLAAIVFFVVLHEISTIPVTTPTFVFAKNLTPDDVIKIWIPILAYWFKTFVVMAASLMQLIVPSICAIAGTISFVRELLDCLKQWK